MSLGQAQLRLSGDDVAAVMAHGIFFDHLDRVERAVVLAREWKTLHDALEAAGEQDDGMSLLDIDQAMQAAQQADRRVYLLTGLPSAQVLDSIDKDLAVRCAEIAEEERGRS